MENNHNPQINDVYLGNWCKYRIFNEEADNSYHCFVLDYDDNSEKHFITTIILQINDFKHMKYLGKATKPIYEFFEVK